MKTKLTIGAALLCSTALAAQQRGGPPRPGLTLTTSAFQDGGEIPAKYTQAVPNPVSPKLEWTNVPDATQSFVLDMIDPDVAVLRHVDPVVHWLAFNIPAATRELAEGGPGAPAVGPNHHYTFELYALDTKLELTADATRADVLKAIDGHILAKAILVGRFKRP